MHTLQTAVQNRIYVVSGMSYSKMLNPSNAYILFYQQFLIVLRDHGSCYARKRIADNQ